MIRKSIVPLVALALALALASISTAQAGGTSDRARCIEEASQAGINVKGVKIITGTEANDRFTPTRRSDVICGFGGDDYVAELIGAGDIFLGGDGNDKVDYLHGSTFNGGAGDDTYRCEYNGLADVFAFDAPKGAARGGFGHDQVFGFDASGSDQLRFVGYTAADLAEPVLPRTTVERDTS